METMPPESNLVLPDITEEAALRQLEQNREMQKLLDSPSPRPLVLNRDGDPMLSSDIADARSGDVEPYKVGRY